MLELANIFNMKAVGNIQNNELWPFVLQNALKLDHTPRYMGETDHLKMGK